MAYDIKKLYVEGSSVSDFLDWNVESASEIQVLKCSSVGDVSVHDNWSASFDASANAWKITIKNTGENFTAYITRIETAQFLLSQTANGKASFDAIKKQLEKNVRILAQLETSAGTSIRAVDEVAGALPDAESRAGKMLSFDEEGKPVCVVKQEDVENIKKYRYEAIESASNAKTSETNASEYANDAILAKLDAQGIYEDVCVKVDGFDAKVVSKTTDFNENYEEKKDAIDEIASDVNSKVDGFSDDVNTAKSELTQHKYDLDDAIDEHFRSVESDFVENVSTEIAKYNDNVSQKTTEFDSHVSSKKSELNNSVQSKIDEAKYYAEEAKKQADEATLISDPEGWRTSTEANITTLSQIKSNRGELYFNGGSMACADKFMLDGPFSCVWTATLNVSDLPTGSNNTWIYTCKHVANSIGFHVGVHQPVDNKPPYMWLQFYYYDSTNASHYISKSFITDCYDGKPHTFAVIFNGGLVQLLIDNEQKLSATLDYDFIPRDCSYPLTVGAITHKISRIKYFNFDMSDVNAPYTIADYIAGKDESPDVAELTLLSLDNSVSGNGVIDNSINRNNAIVSGVRSSMYKGNRINFQCSNYFSWAGTKTTQKFANSDIAIPANSKVVAYAKASVGMSASFTCGSNSAVSKDLSENTLTEIGSFLNASQGAFKVAPSSAITGKMDVYLTIEKF